MGASSLMSLGVSALQTASQQIQTTSHNIANASSPGYSRQRVIQQAAQPLKFGAGYLGMGVETTTVQRASNAFLADRVTTLQSASASDGTRSELLTQLQRVVVGGQGGLGHAATEIFNAFSDLASTPGNASARQVVIGRLDDFVSAARQTGEQVEALQSFVDSELHNVVEDVNGVAQQIALLNRQIVQSSVSGHTPNDLLDKRDLLVKQLSNHVDVQTIEAEDHSLSVFVATGQTLVIGGDANRMSIQRDEHDPNRVGVGLTLHGEMTLLADNHIEGGRLGGLLAFQKGALADARAGLGQVVMAVGGALNQQQALGLDLNGEAGAPLLSLPSPQAMPSNRNAKDAAGNPISSMAISVSDPAKLKASDYLVRFQPSGQIEVTRTRESEGGQTFTLNVGDTLDGLKFDLGASAPTAGESFLVRATAGAANGVEVAMRQPRGLAAANPVVSAVTAGNKGSMAIESTRIASSPTTPYEPMSLRFTDAAGNHEWTDAGGTVVATGTWDGSAPVVWNGVELKLSGRPQAGDRLDVRPTLHVASNNGNALTFDDLADRMLVDGQTAGNAYATLFSSIGVAAQSAQVVSAATDAALGRAAGELSSQTGVDTDEEVARLMQFQQQYQASAKLLQTAQSMLDTVLSVVGR